MNALATFPGLPAKRTRSFRLRLPMLLFWLLLLPLTPFLLLALLIVYALYGVSPFRASAALFRLVAGLKGTHVEVQTREVLITFSLF